jgi:iron complex transport system ATP-binding protein
LSGELSEGLTFLAGKNGSGKSTLLACLLQTIPFSGEIELGNQSTRPLSRKEIARLVAFVPQQLRVPDYVRVREFVLTGRYPYLDRWGNYAKTDHEQVEAALDRMKVLPLADRLSSKLSGGELQRVILARALAQAAPLWLLDEPAHSLDPPGKEELYDLLWELAAEGKTLLCATHDLAPMADPRANIWGLGGGKLVLQQTGGLSEKELMKRVYRV